MKNNWLGIKGKLFILICACLFMFGGTVFYANYEIKNMSSHIEFLGKELMPLSENIAQLRSFGHAIPRFVMNIVIAPRGSEERSTVNTVIDSYQKKFDETLEKIKKSNSLSEKNRKVLEEVDKLNNKMDPLIAKIQKYLSNKEKDEDALAKEALESELIPIMNDFSELMNEIGQNTILRNTTVTDETMSAAVFAQKSMWGISVFVGLFLLVFGYYFSKSLVGSLTRITEAVGSASEQVSSASVQISQGAEKLSSAAQEQASSLEETSASLTEISGMADANTKGAELADNHAKEVFEITEVTRQSMEQLTTAMNQILESNDRIVKLVKIIEEIGEKTEIIDDIVFKTQLLSFNASVEAERAGEHGRGFAVVAQEVGNLAQMSGKAATEISSIVKNSIKEAESVASENKERVEAGGELAGSTKEKMEKVLSKLSGVIEAISKITAASREQSQGVGQITNAIEALNQSTQDTAGTAEQSASASAELTGQAQSLMSLVNELRIIVAGSSSKNNLEKNNKKEEHLSHHENTQKSKVVHMKTAKHRERVEPNFAKAAGAETDISHPVATNSVVGGDGWDKL